ncbi:DNA polymerase III subunit delta [Fodinibius sediminis]|uniref:DNA polymerase III subunit delta n=1 Tax=Fodinibius sediminis TaxID=1214077 RepID=A0A521E790_9BACT|nr:DNA polymerase III subunit delta [Fodinibius sediminis]SMO79271.1 DNA polymerase III, delta subunit [Fodinibius sediminis]
MAKKTSIERYSELLKELKSGDRKAVYFFFGEEEFFLDKLQETVEGLVPEDQKDFNFDLLYGRDITVEKLLSIIRSYPMMAEQRVVILRDFHQLSSYTPGQDSTYEGSVNDLIPYLQQPNPSTLFVCIDPKKPAGNTKIGKALKKSKDTGVHEFKEVPDYRLPDWIISWARSEHSKKIEPPAAQMLAQYVGNSLQLLSTEIDKVCTFVDTSDTVKESHIKKIIGLYREYSVFELKDAMISRNLDKSLFIAEQMLQHSKTNTGEIIRSVGFFYNLFSNIWQIQRLSAQGNSKKQVQDTLGISSSWYFNKLWKDASAFRLSEMPRIFEALLDADRAAKGFSTMDPATILLLMIKRIID